MSPLYKDVLACLIGAHDLGYDNGKNGKSIVESHNELTRLCMEALKGNGHKD